MDNVIDLAVGFDQKEAVAYHTFVQSIIEKTSIPVRFMPLNSKSLIDYDEVHTDGSNDFIYTRFLVPYFKFLCSGRYFDLSLKLQWLFCIHFSKFFYLDAFST